MSQIEESVTYAQFLGTLYDAEQVIWVGEYDGGTRVLVRAFKRWRSFVVTDLLPPSRPFTFSGADLLVTQDPNIAVSALISGLDAVTSAAANITSRGSGNPLTPATTDEFLEALTVLYATRSGTLQPLSSLNSAPGGTEEALVVRTITDSALADSISISGSVVAPAGGATICTMTPGVAGKYEVYAYATITLGAPVAGDEQNMALNVTGVQKHILPYTSTFGGPFGPYRFTLTAALTLNITAVNAGSAAVDYVAGITCRRVS